MFNFKPLHGNVLIKRDEAENEKDSIIIPESWQVRGWRGTIVRIGDEVKGFIPGDIILFSKEHTVLPFKEREYAVTEYKTIPAKLRVDGNVERIYPTVKFVLIKVNIETKSWGHWICDKKIQLIKNRKERICQGVIIRTNEFSNLSNGCHVLFSIDNAILCSEDGSSYYLGEESNVLCTLKF